MAAKTGPRAKQGAGLFQRNGSGQQREHEALQAELYEQIGWLKMEPAWLKKGLLTSVDIKRAMIVRAHRAVSLWLREVEVKQ